METFYDVVQIVNSILNVLLIVLIIVLVNRYKTLREDVDRVINHLIVKGDLEIAKNDLELVKQSVSVATIQRVTKSNDLNKVHLTISDFTEHLQKLLGDEYLLKFRIDSFGFYYIKIYPKGAHEDSGTQFSINSVTFEYAKDLDFVIESLKECNYLK